MIRRTLHERLQHLARQFPAIFLTGPRQSGKTTLARACFPDFLYASLEDLQTRQEITEDPRGFLRRAATHPGVVIDEAQYAPDIFSYVQGYIDDRRGGPVVLTGSQQFLLQARIGQSLAGRTAILELLPFSIAELVGRPARSPDDLFESVQAGLSRSPGELDDCLFRGFFPPIHDRHLDPVVWLNGYVRTYIERDVRLVTGVGDLDTFSRFVMLCAGRSGQLLNLTSLGSDAGVSHTTAKKWLSILRASYVIDFLQPHHRNFSKRLVKSPKLYFLDTGLMCHLLGIRKPQDLRTHPLRGAIFETLVVSELRKLFLHHGQTPPLYMFRDSHGREVDIVIDLGSRRIPVEVKAGETIASDFFRSLDAYLALSKDPLGVLVYGGLESTARREHQVLSWAACT